MSIEPGDTVRLEYVGRFEDGTVFGTSKQSVAEEHGLAVAEAADAGDWTPLSFTVGNGEVIAGLDEAVRGMSVGDDATVTVPPEDAYGAYDPDRVREYDVETFEGMVGQEPEIGLHVEAQNDFHGDVTAISGDTVQVDFNHELAGETLVFDISILSAD